MRRVVQAFLPLGLLPHLDRVSQQCRAHSLDARLVHGTAEKPADWILLHTIFFILRFSCRSLLGSFKPNPMKNILSGGTFSVNIQYPLELGCGRQMAAYPTVCPCQISLRALFQ
jgi:hypothetical protein